jgi:hypothetical protein
VYDDIIENLKLRYVITYKSSTTGDLNSARRVDANGRTIRANIVIQDSYIPRASAIESTSGTGR